MYELGYMNYDFNKIRFYIRKQSYIVNRTS
jgi:hypothetical protein